MNIAMLIAGGTGQRMGQEIPKQFLNVNDKPVIIYTLEAFQRHPDINSIAVVCLEDWMHVLEVYARQFNITKLQYIIRGGESGQASIRNGVWELEKHYRREDFVLVHDAIRPMVSEEVISDCLRVAQAYGNAITVIPCAEAMVMTEDQQSSEALYPREHLKRTQTPQAFRLGEICDLHREAIERGITNSVASVTLMIELGRKVYFSQGSEKNVKLTTVEDIDIFKSLLQAKRSDWLK